ncbi:MAG: acyl-CoA dehydrogenase family protein [Methanomassiliicoccales archaeon]
MQFELDDKTLEARKRAREFALREFGSELAEVCDRTEKYPEEIRRRAFEAGFLDLQNPWAMLVTMEEFCRVDPGLGLSALVPAFGSEVLMLYGSEEQKRKYLEPVMQGKKISAFAVTDPGAGSDVAGIGATLTPAEGGYLLNGQKVFITNGAIANHYYLLARSSPPPSQEKRHRGLSLVIVDADSPGFTAVQMKGKMGMRASNTAELSFHDVFIPKANLIGEEGKGFYYVMTFFNISRIYVAAQATGIAQGALDRLLTYVHSLKESGNEASGSENTQFLISEIATRVEAARMLTYRAASRLFSFNPDPVITSMSKYFAAETAALCTARVLEFMGYDGVNSDMERLYRDAKIMEIWEGSNEVEKLVISRMMEADRK